jgi:hypothetical protein
MPDHWGPIELTKWQELPCISGRPATEADIAEGRAVFAVPTGSAASNIRLPFCAYQKLETGERVLVIAIQAEEAKGQTVVGVRYLEGGNGVCTLSELELVESPGSDFSLRT